MKAKIKQELIKATKVVLVGGLVLATLLATLIIGLKLLGIKPMIIISGSMEPTLRTNSLIIIKDYPIEGVEVGDIVQIMRLDGLDDKDVIHRVIEIKDNGNMLTKGDNNKVMDSWVVDKDNYGGKVVATCNEVAPVISFLFGDFKSIDTTRLVRGFGILVVIAILGLVSVYKLINSRG